ncbi:MAG TPA: YfiR family protein [Clostridia bacterium]|nr:YfiR family protein [Clostridia bacterium]
MPKAQIISRSKQGLFCSLWGLLLVGLLHGAGLASEPVQTAGEREVKAAFLLNFMKFVTWPPGCFSETNAPFVIGVPDKDPQLEPLKTVVSGRTVAGRSVQIQVLETPGQAGGVHVLWVGSRAGSEPSQWVRAVAGRPVLTVGESAGFAASGGVITFVLQGDKMRFDIDMPAARRAGLGISAQLQKLARKVRKLEQEN